MPVQHLLGLLRQSRIQYQQCHLWLLQAVFGHLTMYGGRLLTVPSLFVVLNLAVEVGLEYRVSNIPTVLS